MSDICRIGKSDLFSFDKRLLQGHILLDEESTSRLEYDEYVVFKRPQDVTPAHLKERLEHGDRHVTHKVSHDETPGVDMMDHAFRHGFIVDYGGRFVRPGPDDRSQERMEGRIRRVVCFRRILSPDGSRDGLTLTPQDFEELMLHPATLQYTRRVTTESWFWSKDKSQLSIILSFSSNPKTPYDFLSMKYHVTTRTATILVRQSYHPRKHNLENLDEYDHRMEACRAHWAHPFITPVVLLQVQFSRTEEAVADNNGRVGELEGLVGSIAGFQFSEAEKEVKRADMSRRLSGAPPRDVDEPPTAYSAMNMTNLMKRAHEVLKESINLLDTIKWMERAVQVLLDSGDELEKRLDTAELVNQLGIFSPRVPDPSSTAGAGGGVATKPDVAPADPLGTHWHEIKQYLDGLLRLCVSLETDRKMSELRCRAQIDIIYSKMAQEDNVLNARMAVSSSRDSSSMKALAVITAVFLPGEFIGTLFGMSMFNWMAKSEAEQDAADTGAGGGDGDSTSTSDTPPSPHPVLSNFIWLYFTIAIPLTIFIVFVWRAWWVSQDRYFRRHLPRELSEERYWTSDGRPRRLEHGFWHDFILLSARRDEMPASHRGGGSSGTASGSAGKQLDLYPLDATATGNGSSDAYTDGRYFKDSTAMRQRQILFARRESIRQRGTAVAV